MKKRGLNRMIIVVILILLSITAISLAWLSTQSIVRGTLSEIKSQHEILALSDAFYIRDLVVDPDNDVSFKLEKKTSELQIIGFYVVLEDSVGNTARIDKYENYSLKDFQILKVVISKADHILKDPITKISVYALIKDSEGQNRLTSPLTQTSGGSGSSGGGGPGNENPPQIIFECSDEADNDGDGLIDLNDADCMSSSDNYESQPAAFPGAEGFGAHSQGGRYGRVIHVNTTADYYTYCDCNEDGDCTDYGGIDWQCAEQPIPGSLRWALETQTGPRTIVFDVSGIIDLKYFVRINSPYVTIAGQTAPAPGITLAHYPLEIAPGSHDVIVRYIRTRLYYNDTSHDLNYGVGGNMDGLATYGPTNKADSVHDIILDHCSIAWGIDENSGTWYAVDNFTMQWCVVAEGAMYGHEKGPHSMGYLSGGEGSENFTHISIHHNLFAHNGGRNPLLSNGHTYDLVNNIFYDWANNNAAQLGASILPFQVNFINNFWIDGPSVSDLEINKLALWVPHPSEAALPKVYLGGNLAPLRYNENQDEWAIGVQFYKVLPNGSVDRNFADPNVYGSSTPFPTEPINAQSVNEAKEDVLNDAGLAFPLRDDLDKRIIEEVEYVLENFSTPAYSFNISVPQNPKSYDGIKDPNPQLGKIGPNNGTETEVIFLSNAALDPEYTIYVPRQYRIRPGQTFNDAKIAMLDWMVEKGHITLAQKQQALTDTQNFSWTRVNRTVPDLALIKKLTPTVSPTIKNDSDRDGLPDSWEVCKGLDPLNASDYNMTTERGYTQLEVYLNELPLQQDACL